MAPRKPSDEEELKKCWQKAIVGWDSAVRALRQQSKNKTQSRIREKFFAAPFWPDDEIVITGEAGAGKSVLAKSMLHKLKSPSSDNLPGISERTEGYQCVLSTEVGHGRNRRKIQLTVIPGQASDRRRRAEEAEFITSSPATMVIHAMCWGRNRVWEPENRNVMLDDLKKQYGEPINVEQVFAENKKNELENFYRISELFMKSWKNKDNLTLVIAVTMCDLFKDRLAEVRDYYIPTSATQRREIAQATYERARRDGRLDEAERAREALDDATARTQDSEKTEFAQALNELVRSVGIKRFKHVLVLPVSAVSVDQEEIGIDGAVESSQMSPAEIDRLLSHFVAKVAEFGVVEKRGWRHGS
jgi:GTPase SAR1 family protein